MFSPQESVVIFNQNRSSSGGADGPRRQAALQFWRAYSQGLWRQSWFAVQGKNSRLKDLAEAVQHAGENAVHDAGVQTVPVAQIIGSENRILDFDDRFHPVRRHTEERWIGIAAASGLGAVLPPVELIRVGAAYYVRDGHHRISVARALGQVEIDAHVIEWKVG